MALARALVNDPKILIADEPTGNLDEENKEQILTIFKEANIRGTTVVVATHDRRVIENSHRRVITLEKGRIVEGPMSRNKPAKRAKTGEEGFFGRFNYFFARALANIRQNIFVSVVTVGTITLALLIISFFLLVYVNLEGWRRGGATRCRLPPTSTGTPPLAVAALKGRVKAMPGTAKVVFVGKEEAEKRLRARLKGAGVAAGGDHARRCLPASLEISLKEDNRDSEAVAAYVRG